MDKSQIKEINAGVCPRCKSGNLDYGALEPEDNDIKYPVKCLDCGLDYFEYYSTTFVGVFIEDEYFPY